MRKAAGTGIGKLVRLSTKFRPHGGHALPGLVVDSLMPGYVYEMLRQLPEGIVLVTGTNGKTTTTKMVVEILRANGKRVITNSTGSNMVRGIASSLIKEARVNGRLPFDIAVFEVDEASARGLVAKIKPRWVLSLNASRDQLDRFGEVDTIARHIGTAMAAATEGVITNADDPHLSKIGSQAPIYYFGVAPALLEFFPSDYDLAAVESDVVQKPETAKPLVELSAFKDKSATYKIDGKSYEVDLKLSGQHNFQNGTAALALAYKLLPDVGPAKLTAQLGNVSLAFGRGESYRLPGGEVVELVLVKNPASFRQALASYAGENNALMIAINDNIADGRDTSWLWDVNFEALKGRLLAVTSGTRAADMALRLSYDDIKVETVEEDLHKAMDALLTQRGRNVILATYTAMLSLYRTLNKEATKL